jgi:hypothetical protein
VTIEPIIFKLRANFFFSTVMNHVQRKLLTKLPIQTDEEFVNSNITVLGISYSAENISPGNPTYSDILKCTSR